jgi:hypothetical protein
MDDDAFLEAFLDGSPPGHFAHREHLRVAWTAIRAYGTAEAGRSAWLEPDLLPLP